MEFSRQSPFPQDSRQPPCCEKPSDSVLPGNPQFAGINIPSEGQRIEFMKKAGRALIEKLTILRRNECQHRACTPKINHIDIICPEKSDDLISKLKDIHCFIKKEGDINITPAVQFSCRSGAEQQDKL